MHTLDYMRCRSKNFQRILEIIITAILKYGKNLCILNTLVIFGDVYIMQLYIFDFPKFVYYANDASNCLAYFLFKK